MADRIVYTMTEEDKQKILSASKPIPMIMLQCGMPRSHQQRANDAWSELGSRMGFDFMTVLPEGDNDCCFSAVPSKERTK